MGDPLETYTCLSPCLPASVLVTTLAIATLLILRSRKARARSDEEREADWVVAAAEVELVEVPRSDRRGAAEADRPQKSQPANQQDDTRRLQDLSAEEVATVLHTVGFGAYAPACTGQNITGEDLVYYRSPDELLTCGVETLV